MLPTAMYLRKSRGDPEDESIEETLAKHREILLEFSKKCKLNISEIYYEVVSGDGLFVRPEMIRLLNDIESGLYSGVVCMDIDRLGRVDTKDRGIILDAFKDNNTKIITPTKTYDLADEVDEFSTEMQMLFARQELKKITKRLRIGMMKASEDGYHVTEPPYGYRRKWVDRKPTLEIHPEEANVVRMVFDMYVNQHMGTEHIAQTLNGMGYAPRRSTRFSRTTIQFYLSNPVYIGKIVYNKRKTIKKKKPTDKFKSVLNPKSDWIIADGIHEPIISEELYNEAQRIKKERTHPPAYFGQLMNPLAGLVYCAKCGNIMTRQTSKKTLPRLICNTVGCNKSTMIWKVEDRVLDSIAEALKKSKSAHGNTNKNSDRIRLLKLSISDKKKQLTVLKNQNENLYDLLEQGIYDVKTFTARNRSLSAKIADMEQAIEKDKTSLYTLDTAPRRKELIPVAENLLENYDNMSTEEKNLAFKKLIRRISYTREKVNGSDFFIHVDFNDWI